MSPEPPKSTPPPEDAKTVKAADRAPCGSEDTKDEAPTCCWDHYMEYWLKQMEGGAEETAKREAPKATLKDS